MHLDLESLQAETATMAVPDLDYNVIAKELDMKSPLEIMDHVRLQHPFSKLLLSLTYIRNASHARNVLCCP